MNARLSVGFMHRLRTGSRVAARGWSKSRPRQYCLREKAGRAARDRRSNSRPQMTRRLNRMNCRCRCLQTHGGRPTKFRAAPMYMRAEHCLDLFFDHAQVSAPNAPQFRRLKASRPSTSSAAAPCTGKSGAVRSRSRLAWNPGRQSARTTIPRCAYPKGDAPHSQLRTRRCPGIHARQLRDRPCSRRRCRKPSERRISPDANSLKAESR